MMEDIQPKQAFELIQKNRTNPDFIILDVRTPREFSAGYIEGSVNIDLYSREFRDKIKALEKEKVYFVYCRSGQRSSNVLHLMKEMGFKKVYNLLGGILFWEDQGYSVIR